MNGMKSFKERWAETRCQYGREELENVEFGWDLAIEEMAAFVEANPGLFGDRVSQSTVNVLNGARVRES